MKSKEMILKRKWKMIYLIYLQSINNIVLQKVLPMKKQIEMFSKKMKTTKMLSIKWNSYY